MGVRTGYCPHMRPLFLLGLALALAASGVHAQPRESENAIVFFGGWRASGTLEDTVAQSKVRLNDTAAWSAAIDFGLDPSRQIELFGSRQKTSLAVTPNGATTTTRFPVSVTYVHIGGTNYFDGPVGVGPFVAGGLGITRLTPALDGFASESRPSLSLALGYAIPLGRYAALRVEGRFYWTAINSSGGLFCSGGCTVSLKGDSLQQFEMLAGLSARF